MTMETILPFHSSIFVAWYVHVYSLISKIFFCVPCSLISVLFSNTLCIFCIISVFRYACFVHLDITYSTVCLKKQVNSG